jgi:hypothetical protein
VKIGKATLPCAGTLRARVEAAKILRARHARTANA